MRGALLLTQQAQGGGEPSVPVMAAIIFLCLASPYLIRRWTGKSLGEWLGSLTLLGRLARKKELELQGRAGEKASGQKKKAAKETQPQADEASRAREAQNAYLRFIANTLNFARKNQLFVAVPGKLSFHGEETDFTLVLVTRSRVIGVMAYARSGKITSYPHPGQEGGLPVLEKLVHTLSEGKVPCEALAVYPGKEVSFGPGKTNESVNEEQFFARVSSKEDLSSGKLDAKAFGKRLGTAVVRGGKSKKKKS